MRFLPILVMATSVSIGSAQVFAADAVYRSTAHAGIAVAQSSSTGFRNAAGTTMMFDVTRRIAPDIEIGLRTAGLGGGDGLNFYRLCAGPVLVYELTSGWLAHAHIGTFRESAEDGRDPIYRSSGTVAMVGWEKRHRFIGGAELVYGGFWAGHSGDVHYHTASTAARINEGFTKGLEVGLRIPL